MPPTDSLVREARATIILALPLVIGQVSQMLIGVADTLMIGRLGKVPLAAATFANNIVHLPFMFGIGMSIATRAGDPVRRHGPDRRIHDRRASPCRGRPR